MTKHFWSCVSQLFTLLEKKVETVNISKTVQFLINNDNVTGQIIPVDSGQSIAWLTPDIINIKEWKKKI